MKGHDFKRKLEESLPKYSETKFWWTWSFWGNLASIGGFVALPFSFYVTRNRGVWDWASISVAVTAVLVLFIFSLTVLIYAQTTLSRSRYRHANAVHFFHYVSHIMRDYMAKTIRKDKTRGLDEELQDIVTAIANCFSIIIGRRCRCCIKVVEVGDSSLLEPLLYVRTFARDAQSAPHAHSDNELHALADNTDFSSLCYSPLPFPRVYIANDLHTLFLNRKYNNTSIKEDYQADSKRGKILNWPLPYVSTLVVPIRYVADFSPPKKNESISQNWIFWGFLCIDCNHKNAFLDPDLLELAGGFADSIYSFVSNVEHRRETEEELFSIREELKLCKNRTPSPQKTPPKKPTSK